MQALLIDHDPYSLVIPVDLVAEIVGKVSIRPTRYSLDWVIGHFKWRKLRVPMLSISALLGLPDDDTTNWNRVVVIWPMKGGAKTDFFALICQETPRVVEISDSDAVDAEQIADSVANSLGFIKSGDKVAVIPDLKSITTRLFSGNRSLTQE